MISEPKICFTLNIIEGKSFELSFPPNPILIYPGSRTLWKVVATRTQISEIVSYIQGLGCQVTLYSEDEPEPET